MPRTVRVACTMAAMTAVAIAAAGQPGRAPRREIDNVAAFAQLYGVARFFYPGDAAASLDWDRFAVDGVARVRTAPDANELASRLRALFVPLGPGIEIGPTLAPYGTPAASSEPLIAWRYTGAGATDNMGGGPYAGKRTNRPRRLSAAGGFVGFAQAVAAQDLRGRAIRLRGQARATAGATSSGGALWLRVDRGAQGVGFFDNMGDRLIRDTGWREHTIEGTVADDATNVVFGVMAVGGATADFDALELSTREADGSWRALSISDAGFEADTGAAGWNRVGSAAGQITRQTDNPPEGRQFVRFAPAPAAVSNEELFPDAPPAIGDHVDIDLGGGLRARIALTLTDSQAKSPAAPAAGGSTSGSGLDGRLADVVVAWNFYRHFYPYFAEAAIDWNARLRPDVEAMYGASTRSAEADALRGLVADARDGHGRVNDTRQRGPLGTLPLQMAIVESRLVVKASDAPGVPVGAVILAIDGVVAADRVTSAMRLASGTTQWKQVRAVEDIVSCRPGATMHLTIDSGNGSQSIDLPCAIAQTRAEARPAPIAQIAPDIWYVDLSRARTADLTPVVDTLAKAHGVVFDVRGYPTDAGVWLLPHLINAPESDRWMHVSKIVGPFGKIAGWQDLGWDLKPAAPKIAGKVVFLTDGRAISYAESVMGYVADHHLGTIVGGTTAGTNGNVATFTVPGGFAIVFTGMRVTGHDGRAVHHLVGVKPDVPAARTIAGLRAGRDEVLARAVSLIP
jgi:peptidase S41-like protein